jgi:hypothetical protein
MADARSLNSLWRETSSGWTLHGFADQHFHGERWTGDELLDGACRDAADAFGLAPVEAESELPAASSARLWILGPPSRMRTSIRKRCVEVERCSLFERIRQARAKLRPFSLGISPSIRPPGGANTSRPGGGNSTPRPSRIRRAKPNSIAFGGDKVNTALIGRG